MIDLVKDLTIQLCYGEPIRGNMSNELLTQEVLVENIEDITTVRSIKLITETGTESNSVYNLYTYDISSILNVTRVVVTTYCGSNTKCKYALAFNGEDGRLLSIPKGTNPYECVVPSGTIKILVNCVNTNSRTPSIEIYRLNK